MKCCVYSRFQASTSIIYFTKTLWPEFTFWHLLAGVFYYQRHYQTMHSVKQSLNQFSNLVVDEMLSNGLQQSKITTNSQSTVFSQRATVFLEKFDTRQYNQLLELSRIVV